MKKPKTGFYAQKYVLIACVLLLIVNLATTAIIVNQSKKNTIDSMHQRMLDICETASKSINGDALASIEKEDVENQSADYLTIYNALSVYRNIEDLTYIYVVREGVDEAGKTIYTYVVDTDPEDPAEYGYKSVDSSALLSAGKGFPTVDRLAVEDEWGKLYSAYCPVYDSNGAIVGVVGIDYTPLSYERSVTREAWFYFISFAVSLLVGSILVVVITAHLRRRINVLNKEASALASDVEGLTKEFVANANEFAKASETKLEKGKLFIENAKEAPSSDIVDELAHKIRFMQKVVKKYTVLLHSSAYTDVMTGVGNKTAYLETVRAIDKKISEGTADFVAIFCDINALKVINDNYGHEIGDKLIVDSAVVLKQTFGSDHIYRIGGDEFIIILENTPETELAELFEKLSEELKKANAVEHRYEVDVSFSVGYSRFLPGEDTKFKHVFKRADQSMYRNKEQFYKDNADIPRRGGTDV